MRNIGEACDLSCARQHLDVAGDEGGKCYELFHADEAVAVVHWKLVPYIYRYSDGAVFEVPALGEVKVKLP